MGAAIAYGLACERRRRGGGLPQALFVAARRAPQVSLTGAPLHDLPDTELKEALRARRQVPDEVLAHEELTRLVLPIVRADLAVDETAAFPDEPQLAMPISAFHGLGDDLVAREDVERWRPCTSGRFRLRALPGDHFFVHSGRGELLESIARDLATLAPPA